MPIPIRRHSGCRRPLLATLCAACMPLSAAAADCSVNVFDAYQTAVKRGWSFSCSDVSPGMSTNFVTYPPTNIGCVVKTPPLHNGALGVASLFERNVGQPYPTGSTTLA